jgi:hypothetical protein
MPVSWRGFVTDLIERTGASWRRWERHALTRRTLLAITRNSRCKGILRTLSFEQGWRILFAETLEEAIRLQTFDRISIVVYDRQFQGVEWQDGLSTLLAFEEPTLTIVLSDVLDARLRSEVLECGGYDLAQSPLEPARFASLVNGAFSLIESIDSIDS